MEDVTELKHTAVEEKKSLPEVARDAFQNARGAIDTLVANTKAKLREPGTASTASAALMGAGGVMMATPDSLVQMLGMAVEGSGIYIKYQHANPALTELIDSIKTIHSPEDVAARFSIAKGAAKEWIGAQVEHARQLDARKVGAGLMMGVGAGLTVTQGITPMGEIGAGLFFLGNQFNRDTNVSLGKFLTGLQIRSNAGAPAPK